MLALETNRMSRLDEQFQPDICIVFDSSMEFYRTVQSIRRRKSCHYYIIIIITTMKLKTDTIEKTDKPSVIQNGSIKKTKKKAKDNFEVRIPRIIVRNLNFKVRKNELECIFI